MVSWNPDLLEKHVAPEISAFTEAYTPDLQDDFEQHKYWLANHFLNSAMRSAFKPPIKQYVLNYIYRSQVLFRLYHEAINSTSEYLKGNEPHNPKIGKYFDAISIWETVFHNWAVAFDLVVKLNGNNKFFVKGSGSEEERAYDINNEIKHCGGSIFGGHWTENSTIPIWLTNTGITSHKNHITYIEISELVREVAKFANKLQDLFHLRNLNSCTGKITGSAISSS